MQCRETGNRKKLKREGHTSLRTHTHIHKYTYFAPVHVRNCVIYLHIHTIAVIYLHILTIAYSVYIYQYISDFHMHLHTRRVQRFFFPPSSSEHFSIILIIHTGVKIPYRTRCLKINLLTRFIFAHAPRGRDARFCVVRYLAPI